MSAEIWIPVIVAIVVGTFGIINTVVNRRDVKPVKDVLKKTKIEGDGSLVEALGALSKEYKDSQERHSEEIKYFVEQLTSVRQELIAAKKENEEKDREIIRLKRQVAEHEARLNEGHIGIGK